MFSKQIHEAQSERGARLAQQRPRPTPSNPFFSRANHGLQYLSRCDRVVLLKQGRVAAVGSFEQLCADEALGFAEVLASSGGKEEEKERAEEGEHAASAPPASAAAAAIAAGPAPCEGEQPKEEGGGGGGGAVGQAGKAIVQAIDKEEQATGEVARATYGAWLRAGGKGAGGSLAAVLVLVLVLVGQGLASFTHVYLAQWSAATAAEQQRGVYMPASGPSQLPARERKKVWVRIAPATPG